MARKIAKKINTELETVDNTVNELFDLDATRVHSKSLSYIPSWFTTASLPFRNVHKTVFVRKGSQGVTLTLTSPKNVPFGKYGRLLLSVLTTHAVITSRKNNEAPEPVVIEYESLADLLKELQLPKQRGKDIREQLECYSNAAFAFDLKETVVQAGYLFKNLYEEGNYPKGDVTVTTRSTGNIRFTEGIQYKEISDGQNDSRFGHFKIVLSGEFVGFCQKHGVPIDYGVYKEISSAVGKDIYAWLVFRNHGLSKPQFISRERLVEQFMPVDENSNPNQENVNFGRIVEYIKEIKEKYYPEVKVGFNENGAGITLYKSPTPVIENDVRYTLITSDI